MIDEHFDSFQQDYDKRFQAKYGFWRPIVEQSVAAFLKCGDLQEGFARVRCRDCNHEMFVAFSCKQRCTCPSCHQKRTLLTAIHVAEEVCSPVAHRLERLIQYMTRCPFSLSRLVKVSDTGQVVYQADESQELTYVDIDTFLESF